MTEDFLHYIWQYKLLKPQKLALVTGEEISIIKPGEKNTDAGPDFFNARIKIGDTLWAGNVEIHTNASDWLLHKHSTDKAYDNIILHIVYNNDKTILNKVGKPVPTLVLKNLFDESKFKYYQYLQKNKSKIPCENNFGEVPSYITNAWLERILLERLEKKADAQLKNLNKTQNNWNEVFFISLARSMGFGINAEPMELLAKSLPLSILSKHKNSHTQTEALLFGQAGLLDKETGDEYYQQLKKEYAFLKNKYSFTPLPAHLWKHLRLRPANFPALRIAQLAGIIFNTNNLFSEITNCDSVKHIAALLNISPGNYWETHYQFSKRSTKKNKTLSKVAINQIIINTIVPLLFVYGKQRGNETLCEKALQWLEACAPEKNNITNYWTNIGAECKNAWQSQALLELRKEYCNNKKCLSCGIGNHLLKIK